MYSIGTFCARYQLFSEGNHLCVPISQLEHHWPAQFPEVVASPPGQMWPEDTLHSRWKYDSSPCLGMGKLGSRASKNLCLRIQIRQICTLQSSLVKVCPQLSSADEQSHWLGLVLGRCRYELSLPRFMHWLLQALPPFSLIGQFQWLRLTDSPAIPVVQNQSRGSHKITPVLGVGTVFFLGVSFPTGGARVNE